VLIIGAGLSWLVRTARIQHDAVASIRKGGGSVYYNWEGPLDYFGTKRRDPGPRWLVDQLGVDYFGHVSFVLCQASNVDSIPIGHLGEVEFLFLSGSALTDDGLSRLRGLNRLRSLQLDGTKVTDVGLGALERFTCLFYLNLSNTDVGDAGVHRVKHLNALQTLGLRGTRVTDVGVRRLQTALPQLVIVR
jgi:hypothetical protein